MQEMPFEPMEARPFLPSSERSTNVEAPHKRLVMIASDDIDYLRSQGVLSPDGRKTPKEAFSDRGLHADITFYDEKHIVMYMCKPTFAELTNSRTVSQIQALLAELSKQTSDGLEGQFAIATWFALDAIARKVIERAISGIEGDTNLDSITTRTVTEIDHCYIEAPEGYDVGKGSDLRDDREVVGNKTRDVRRGFVPIEKLHYDPENIRILGIDEVSLTEEECERRLLNDGDKTSDWSAVNRRYQMLRGYITTPLVCNQLTNGEYRVIDGNSRLALARDIRRRTDGQAVGYGYLPVIVFPGSVTAEELNSHKNEIQHAVKLEHGVVRDAFEAYRQVSAMTPKGQRPSARILECVAQKLRTTKDKVERAYAAVDTLHNRYGLPSDMVKRLYTVAFCLTGVKWGALDAKWKKAGITEQGMMDFFIKGQGNPDIAAWNESNAIHNLERFLVNQTKRTRGKDGKLAPHVPDDWELRIMTNLVGPNQNPDWVAPKAWDSYQKVEVRNHRSKTTVNRRYVQQQTSVAHTILGRVESKFKTDIARAEKAQDAGRSVKTEHMFVSLDEGELIELQAQIQDLKNMAARLQGYLSQAIDIRQQHRPEVTEDEDIYDDGYLDECEDLDY